MTPSTLPSVPPLTAATDAATLARLRTLPAPETTRLLSALDALPTPEARQDYLIAEHRLALTLPALSGWMDDARRESDARRFRDFLIDVRRAAERAENFRDLLADAERLQQVNVALLAARLFDALVDRDARAIETLAHTFAEVVQAARQGCRLSQLTAVSPLAADHRHGCRDSTGAAAGYPLARVSDKYG